MDQLSSGTGIGVGMYFREVVSVAVLYMVLAVLGGVLVYLYWSHAGELAGKGLSDSIMRTSIATLNDAEGECVESPVLRH